MKYFQEIQEYGEQYVEMQENMVFMAWKINF